MSHFTSGPADVTNYSIELFKGRSTELNFATKARLSKHTTKGISTLRLRWTMIIAIRFEKGSKPYEREKKLKENTKENGLLE